MLYYYIRYIDVLNGAPASMNQKNASQNQKITKMTVNALIHMSHDHSCYPTNKFYQKDRMICGCICKQEQIINLNDI